MKTNLNRIERMCVVVETAVERMLVSTTHDIQMIYMYRYNFWWGMLEKEIDSNTKIEIHMLKISFYMECLITNYICAGQEYEILRKEKSVFKSIQTESTNLPIDWWVESLSK